MTSIAKEQQFPSQNKFEILKKHLMMAEEAKACSVR
jgi:hypothetical protein